MVLGLGAECSGPGNADPGYPGVARIAKEFKVWNREEPCAHLVVKDMPLAQAMSRVPVFIPVFMPSLSVCKKAGTVAFYYVFSVTDAIWRVVSSHRGVLQASHQQQYVVRHAAEIGRRVRLQGA